jgi:hypothetical protein
MIVPAKPGSKPPASAGLPGTASTSTINPSRSPTMLADRTPKCVINFRHTSLHVGLFTGNAGQVRQRTELTAAQRDILAKLGVPEPARFVQLDPATR